MGSTINKDFSMWPKPSYQMNKGVKVNATPKVVEFLRVL